MTSAVILGMIVTMFPEPRRAGEGDRRLRLRRLGGRLGRAAGRRRADPGDQLALDLLHQRADRHRHRRAGRCGCSTRDEGIGLGEGADIPGAVLITGALMLGVYTIVKPAAEHGWGVGADARARRGIARAAGGLHRPRGRTAQPARCRCGSSARATSRAPTSSRRCRSPACSAMFFLGALYLQRVLGYDALEIGLAFLPARSSWACCRCATRSR